MVNPTDKERARQVRSMFSEIAPHYDLMNRIMTAGQDLVWRREVIQRAGLKHQSRLLDLGAGTGDLAFEALRQHPDCQIVPADFSLKMMHVGQARSNGERLDWSATDGRYLAFPDATFDAVVSAFLVRNVVALSQALCEQHRVLKPGGRIVILDTTRPPNHVLTPLVRLHLNVIIPALGRWITGQSDAYDYLSQSTNQFLQAEVLAAQMVDAGFQQVSFQRRMFAPIAIHWGVK